MQGTQPAYSTAYHSLKLTRDAQGVLVVEFHSNGGPLTLTASDHTEFVEAFAGLTVMRRPTVEEEYNIASTRVN